MFVLMLLQKALPFIILVGIGLYVYCKYFIYTFWSKRRIPYPEPTFLLGNLRPFLFTSGAEIFCNWRQQYKKDGLFGIYMFHVPVLVVTDPDLIGVVLQKEFQSFQSRGICSDGELDPLMKNLVCVPGERWKHLHSKIKSAYSPARTKQMLPLWDNAVNCLSRFLTAKAESNTTFETMDTITRYYTDVITGSTFGINTTSLSENGAVDNPFHVNSGAFHVHTIWVVFFIFLPEFYSYMKVPIVSRRIRKFFFKIVEDLIKYRTTNNIKNKDIFDVLMKLTKNNDEPSNTAQIVDKKESSAVEFTLEDTVANAYAVYMAGHETSSLTTTYCLYELAMNPAIQEKIRQEVTSVLEKHDAITYDALSEMTYLDKVVYETMRKYPAIPVIQRVCNRDVDLPMKNIRIPTGLKVLLPVYAIHWDPDIYPQPQIFDPERFSKENIASRPSNTFFPFGQGPRMCVGSKMALIITKFTIATILSKYRFRRVAETPPFIVLRPGQIGLTTTSKIPLAVELL